MTKNMRATTIIIGCLLTLAGSTFFPWFTIRYYPIGGYNSHYFTFDLLTLISYFKDLSSIKSYFIHIGFVILIGFIALLRVPFAESYIVKNVLNVTYITSFVWAVFSNVHGNTILKYMNIASLQTFYGITDTKYITAHSSVSLDQGFFISLIGIIISAIGLYLPQQADNGSNKGFFIILLSISMLTCCCFGAFDATHGYNYPENNAFYENGHQLVINSNQGWQNSNISLLPGDIVYILYIPNAGLWTTDILTNTYTDANGKPPQNIRLNQNGLPLLGFSSQALIGRVGTGSPFLIGNAISFLASESRQLTLRMNQSDTLIQQAHGSIRLQVMVYRYESGATKSMKTVTINLSSQWQDTHIAVGGNDIIGITYVYKSDSGLGSNIVVASDNMNAQPPDFIFIRSGAFSTSPLPSLKDGLVAKIGSNPAFYCGYSIIARSIDQAQGGNIYLSIRGKEMPGRTIQVIITTIHVDTVSTYNYI